jgi:hypothetical protein
MKRARKKPQQKEEKEEISKMPEKQNKIYWAPARRYCLHLSKKDPDVVGLYQKEKRDLSGGILQVAVPISFGEHILATDDPKVQAVIEKSAAFENGEIVLCESMDAAYQRTAALGLEKTVSAGLVTMDDNSIRIGSIEDAQAEAGKHPEVTAG